MRYGKHRQSDEAGKNRLVCHRGRATRRVQDDGKPKRSERQENHVVAKSIRIFTDRAPRVAKMGRLLRR